MRFPPSRHRSARHPTWLWVTALLCVSLLFCASTAQACHAHDALLRLADGKAQLSAPLDECPLCVAPHAAMLAETQTTVARTQQSEALVFFADGQPHRGQWHFDLFSRPPPAALTTAHI